MTDDEIKKYLPQYLSESEMRSLKDDLRKFNPDTCQGAFFTSRFNGEPFLMQGDYIGQAPVHNFPASLESREVPALIISNTCDMSMDNKRVYSTRIMYVPMMNFDKYAQNVLRIMEPEKARQHFESLRNQHITGIIYLPTKLELGYDSIGFLDRMVTIPCTQSNIDHLISSRRFTLNNFGFYLLLLKLSMHFSRIQEKINRG